MKTISHPKEIEAFFHRYKKFTEDRFEIRIQFFKNQFNQLRIGFDSTMRAVHETEKYRSSRFNLFNILGVARLEVWTHSALLGDLLNPEGSHGQQHLFLISLLEHMNAKRSLGKPGGNPFPRIEPEDAIKYSWFVEKEKSNAFGRMDVVVSSPELSFLMIIENKIDAEEQQKQIERYAQWMESQRRHYKKGVVLYLTPKGEKSLTNVNHEYFRISYNEDVCTWLEKTLPQVKSERVRRSLEQYIELVRIL